MAAARGASEQLVEVTPRHQCGNQRETQCLHASRLRMQAAHRVGARPKSKFGEFCEGQCGYVWSRSNGCVAGPTGTGICLAFCRRQPGPPLPPP